MFKKDTESNKVSFVRQGSADVASNRGRKKKVTPDVSTLSTSFVQKTKKQPVVQSVSFSIPANIQGNEEASVQYLTEQLSAVNREIERLHTKKEQITDLLMDILQKKRQEMRDENEEEDENNKYSFINNSRVRSSSQYGSQKKNVARFRDDPYHNEDDSFASSQSQKSNKKADEISNILNELQTNKSMIRSKINESGVFNNNNNTSALSHTLQAQAANDTSALYQSFMVRENSQSLGNKQKLDEYNKMKERCLWQHFDYKETIQDKLKNVDSLEDNQLKELAKTFGVKSNNNKLLKENLKNINSFLGRNKFPDEYLREFKTCIHDKIDVL